MQGGAPGPGAAARPALKGEAGTHVSLDQKITSAPRWAMGRVLSLSRFVPRSVFLGSSRGWRAGAGAPAGHLALGHRLLLSAARCDRCWQGASRPGWGPGSGAWDGGQTSTPPPPAPATRLPAHSCTGGRLPPTGDRSLAPSGRRGSCRSEQSRARGRPPVLPGAGRRGPDPAEPRGPRGHGSQTGSRSRCPPCFLPSALLKSARARGDPWALPEPHNAPTCLPAGPSP